MNMKFSFLKFFILSEESFSFNSEHYFSKYQPWSGNCILPNTSSSISTETNGPLKHAGGGSRVHNWAAAEGKGKVPPIKCSFFVNCGKLIHSQNLMFVMLLEYFSKVSLHIRKKHSIINCIPGTGCSPGNEFTFGLKGIICDKSGLGKAAITSSVSWTRCIAQTPFLIVLVTSMYPIDFSSIAEQGYKSKNLYLSTNWAVSLPSNSFNWNQYMNI